MTDYHGIIVYEGLRDESFLKTVTTLGYKKTSDFRLYKISVPEDDINDTMSRAQDAMEEGPYYCHFYRKHKDIEELFIAFKHRIYRVTADESTWQEPRAHGLSLHIPLRQLDFYPRRIEDETW